MNSWQIIEGDCRDTLRSLDAGSAQTCVTSPPYYGLRDYGLPPVTWADGWVGCLGLEPMPDMYVAHMVEVFAAVRHALADDGTVWLNLGDSYADNANGRHTPAGQESRRRDRARCIPPKRGLSGDLKPKDLIGIPWMVAFALRADGWYLRSDIIWAKPNPMPESVTDRPTKAHEYLFLLSKSARYFYDAPAIAEQATNRAPGNVTHKHTTAYEGGDEFSRTKGGLLAVGARETRTKRSVWTVATHPFPGAHFATFPPKLIEPCILAGCPEGGTVLDPFAGAGTTGMVALRHNRSFVGCELSPEYARMARERIVADSPLLNTTAEAA